MRVLSLSAGVFVVVALSIGATSVVRNHLVSSHALTATSQVAAAAVNGVDANDPAPQRMIPRPSPDPSPTAAPAAPAPAATRSAPVVAHAAPPPALVIGSTQQSLINRDRAAHGLGPLTWSSCLYSVAVRNAARISTEGTSISHANGVYQDLACGVGRQSGENIGWWSGGVNDSQLNTMFMNSPEHRANILGPYHYVATAWKVAPNGYGYIAVELS
jgi:uncharacterized protein YkwD